MTDEGSTPVLDKGAITLGQTAASMDEVIEFVGGILVDRGLVGPGYIDGMKQREETVSTYLGNGVALPHGTIATQDEIKGTGIVVAQYPDGIEWGDGTARLVIGLAAIGDEHVEVLSQLAEVLQDEDLCERLSTTDDVEFVYSTLTANSSSEDDEASSEDQGVQELTKEVTIVNPSGLHARPAALLVERTQKMTSNVTIAANGKTADAKSILSVLALGATAGDVAVISATGTDAEQAIAQISEIMESTEEEL